MGSWMKESGQACVCGDAGGDDGRDGAGAGGRHLQQPWGEEGEAP